MCLSLLCVVSTWCPCVQPAAEGGLWAVLVPNWAVLMLCLKGTLGMTPAESFARAPVCCEHRAGSRKESR